MTWRNLTTLCSLWSTHASLMRWGTHWTRSLLRILRRRRSTQRLTSSFKIWNKVWSPRRTFWRNTIKWWPNSILDGRSNTRQPISSRSSCKTCLIMLRLSKENSARTSRSSTSFLLWRKSCWSSRERLRIIRFAFMPPSRTSSLMVKIER